MTNKKILVFGGTYEGRKCCEYLVGKGLDINICVATDYGEEMLKDLKHATILVKRLDEQEMICMFDENKFEYVIDATHPYAKVVTINIKNACDKTKTNYIRLLREENEYDNVINVGDTFLAVEYLKNTTGNILVTTGSKEIALYSQIPNYKERIFARVLPTAQVINECNDLGIKAGHVIGMQGPFSVEMNVAMIKDYKCKYLVTKNTGVAGGIDEKILAAKLTNTKVILIDRPTLEVGFSLSETINILNKKFNIKSENKEEIIKMNHFPLFCPSKNKNVLVIGSGNIATRRINTLLKFEFNITVISNTITEEIQKYVLSNKLTYINLEIKKENVETIDFLNFYLIVVATNNRKINKLIGHIANNLNIFVSVADEKSECSFYFPSIITKPNTVIGITSDGNSHKYVKYLSTKILEVLT